MNEINGDGDTAHVSSNVDVVYPPVKVDLTDYEKSGTWDVYDVPSRIVSYDAKTGRNTSRAYYDVRLRRKTLFYTVNLIIPSVLISCLSMVTFYLPTTAGEKVTMSVSILLALVVFLQVTQSVNPLIATLKPQSNGPSYSNTMTGTLAVDGWAVTVTAQLQRGWDWEGRQPARPLLAVSPLTAHPSTASVSTSYYSMWHYNCLWSLKS